MIITFFGHSIISTSQKVEETVKEEIRKQLFGCNLVTCYLGGYGDFDSICARACQELKKETAGIKLIYVTPYMNLSQQSKMKAIQSGGLYDEVVFPPLENVPPKLAILKRNEWMISNADLIFVYVNHSHGGAYQALQTALRKKKRVINIFDLMKKPH